ncbi:uncharacterized protein EV422DRAFT_260830 [Fimicolochytrium jonesii]|uniref:uncharacterized protein n=1 Tax=Fimicolochytrium jonesii TaxID=1396493 RepID=UPI0022FE400C|nr:uncharacterized protein EV422DRAFT_260830 [Fimicolochytrium jonesii]KAI8817015.1 hypothetical protein EV422DRAFT_260830 [Fimicolochytrium jonesii]
MSTEKDLAKTGSSEHENVKKHKEKAKGQAVFPIDHWRPILNYLPFKTLITFRAVSRACSAEANMVLEKQFGWQAGYRLSPIAIFLAEEGILKLHPGKMRSLMNLYKTPVVVRKKKSPLLKEFHWNQNCPKMYSTSARGQRLPSVEMSLYKARERGFTSCEDPCRGSEFYEAGLQSLEYDCRRCSEGMVALTTSPASYYKCLCWECTRSLTSGVLKCDRPDCDGPIKESILPVLLTGYQWECSKCRKCFPTNTDTTCKYGLPTNLCDMWCTNIRRDASDEQRRCNHR